MAGSVYTGTLTPEELLRMKMEEERARGQSVGGDVERTAPPGFKQTPGGTQAGISALETFTPGDWSGGQLAATYRPPIVGAPVQKGADRVDVTQGPPTGMGPGDDDPSAPIDILGQEKKKERPGATGTWEEPGSFQAELMIANDQLNSDDPKARAEQKKKRDAAHSQIEAAKKENFPGQQEQDPDVMPMTGYGGPQVMNLRSSGGSTSQTVYGDKKAAGDLARIEKGVAEDKEAQAQSLQQNANARAVARMTQAADIDISREKGQKQLEELDKATAEKRAKIDEDREAAYNMKVDPNLPAAQRIGFAIASAFTGFAHGYSMGRVQNTAVQMLENAVNHHIKSQLENIKSKKDLADLKKDDFLRDALQRRNDLKEAIESSITTTKEYWAARLDAMADRQTSEEKAAVLRGTAAEVRAREAERRLELSKKQVTSQWHSQQVPASGSGAGDPGEEISKGEGAKQREAAGVVRTSAQNMGNIADRLVGTGYLQRVAAGALPNALSGVFPEESALVADMIYEVSDMAFRLSGKAVAAQEREKFEAILPKAITGDKASILKIDNQLARLERQAKVKMDTYKAVSPALVRQWASAARDIRDSRFKLRQLFKRKERGESIIRPTPNPAMGGR